MPAAIKDNKNSVHIDINIQNASVIKDFIVMREDIIDIVTSDKQNLTSIIDFLCTTTDTQCECIYTHFYAQK